ncbi:dienelactone hydrolase family protein [Sphingomonas sp.]|uniref:dienelactone hydrolase family protein n=1 Tax=Sphingomonas sp. TaxID=28214 RepID=UPI0025D1A62E|nr:dienelactone hydrolase family protein [Sphingomonas sp.]
MIPNDVGPWPGVIFYMDGLAIRPALLAMAKRLACCGYVVLLPDLFYRAGSYDTPDAARISADDGARADFRKLMSVTDNRLASQDTEAYLAYLDSRSDVSGPAVGVVGYCLGGGVALTVAGDFADRIAVAASFHGGHLATDLPTSPHLSVHKIRGRVLVASADGDPSYPPEMAERLETEFRDAGVDHRCETFLGAKHGWTMADLPAFDAPAAERHWRELTALFAGALPAHGANERIQ